MPRAKGKDPLGDKILSMVKAGMLPGKIAGALKIRKAYVYVVLYRKGYSILRLNPLEDDQQRWLSGQAQRSKVSVDEMARAMLVDVISRGADNPVAKRTAEEMLGKIERRDSGRR